MSNVQRQSIMNPQFFEAPTDVSVKKDTAKVPQDAKGSKGEMRDTKNHVHKASKNPGNEYKAKARELASKEFMALGGFNNSSELRSARHADPELNKKFYDTIDSNVSDLRRANFRASRAIPKKETTPTHTTTTTSTSTSSSSSTTSTSITTTITTTISYLRDKDLIAGDLSKHMDTKGKGDVSEFKIRDESRRDGIHSQRPLDDKSVSTTKQTNQSKVDKALAGELSEIAKLSDTKEKSEALSSKLMTMSSGHSEDIDEDGEKATPPDLKALSKVYNLVPDTTTASLLKNAGSIIKNTNDPEIHEMMLNFVCDCLESRMDPNVTNAGNLQLAKDLTSIGNKKHNNHEGVGKAQGRLETLTSSLEQAPQRAKINFSEQLGTTEQDKKNYNQFMGKVRSGKVNTEEVKLFSQSLGSAVSSLKAEIPPHEIAHLHKTTKPHLFPIGKKALNDMNSVTWNIQNEILSGATKKERVNTLKFYAQVMDDCVKSRDYETALLINTALNATDIARLNEAPKETQKIIDSNSTFLSPMGRFRAVREASQQNGAALPVAPILITATFVDDGNEAKKDLDGGQTAINYDRLTMFANTISDFQNSQALRPSAEGAKFLGKGLIGGNVSEQSVEARSLEIKPRGR